MVEISLAFSFFFLVSASFSFLGGTKIRKEVTLVLGFLSGYIGIETLCDSGCFSGLLGGNIISHLLSKILEVSSNDRARSWFFTMRNVKVVVVGTNSLHFILFSHLLVIN